MRVEGRANSPYVCLENYCGKRQCDTEQKMRFFLKSEWSVIKMTTTWALEKRGCRNPKNVNVGLSVLDKECLEEWLWSKASHC